MLKLLLGDPNARKLKRYQPIVSDINLLEEEIALFLTTISVAKQLPSRIDWPMPAAWRTSVQFLTRSCPRPLPLFVKRARGFWECAISMCS